MNKGEKYQNAESSGHENIYKKTGGIHQTGLSACREGNRQKLEIYIMDPIVSDDVFHLVSLVKIRE